MPNDVITVFHNKRSIFLERLIFILIFLLSLEFSPVLFSQEEPSVEDSTEVIQVEPSADSVEIADSADTADEEASDSTEADYNWTYSAYTSLKSSQVKKGFISNNGKPVLSPSIGISFKDALSFDFDYTKQFGSDKLYNDFSFSLDYSYSVWDWLDIGATYSKSNYTYDSTSIFTDASNSISLSSDIIFWKCIFDLSYERLWGKDAFNNFSFSAISSIPITENLKIVPILSAQYVFFTIDISNMNSSSTQLKLKKLTKLLNKNKKTYSDKGLSDISMSLKLSYKLGMGFAAFASASYSYAPFDISKSKKYLFAASLGFQYSLDF